MSVQKGWIVLGPAWRQSTQSKPGRERVGGNQGSTHHPEDGKLIKPPAKDAPRCRCPSHHSTTKPILAFLMREGTPPPPPALTCSPCWARKTNTAPERKWHGGVFEVRRKEHTIVTGFLGCKCVPSFFCQSSLGGQPVKPGALWVRPEFGGH